MSEQNVRIKMNRRVVITGMCVATGNGANKEEFRVNLFLGKLGIKECSLFPTQKLRTSYFGELEQPLAYEATTWSENGRMEALMEQTLPYLYTDASYSKEEIMALGNRACICFASLLGHIGKIVTYAKQEKMGDTDEQWLSHCMDYVTWLKENSGITGGCYIDSAACASGTTSVGMAYDFIKNGLYDMALVGGADPLTEFSAYGFHAIQSLSRRICRPFDRDRDGINIGEGAAFFLLETLESAQKRNAPIYAEVFGYGLNNDAYHATSPDPSALGAIISMKKALKQGGISPSQVDYINVHGTGTQMNDAMECKAIHEVFKENTEDLAINSTKALVGHCMGASGVIELAAVLLSMQEEKCAPMPDLKNKMQESEQLHFCVETEYKKITYALSNSFAFAGNTASLLVGLPRE